MTSLDPTSWTPLSARQLRSGGLRIDQDLWRCKLLNHYVKIVSFEGSDGRWRVDLDRKISGEKYLGFVILGALLFFAFLCPHEHACCSDNNCNAIITGSVWNRSAERHPRSGFLNVHVGAQNLGLRPQPVGFVLPRLSA